MRRPLSVLIAVVLSTPVSAGVFAALPPCPSGGAALTISIDNHTGSSQAVTLTGTLVSRSCFGSGSTSFVQTVQCGNGLTACTSRQGLQPGIWLQQISVGAQQQFKKVLLVADPGTANTLSWTAFNTVLTVDRTDDDSIPTPRCPSLGGTPTCTLRQAIAAGGAAPAPVLVQFDPAAFPAATLTAVQLTQSAKLSIDGAGMVIDGTDANGNPSFRGDPYSRMVQLPRTGGNFVFTNRDGALIGLLLQRPTLSAGARPGDMIVFDGTSGETARNVVLNCKLNGGAGSLRKKITAHDCIEGVAGAGPSWDDANVIENCEITACPDKAVKSITRAYVRVVDSWIHHNIGGGLQATLSGNLEADRNVVELSGYNPSRQVFTAANGVSANGAAPATPDVGAMLQTDGNIIRNNSARGISVQELSAAALRNDFSCGASNAGRGGQNGIAIFNASGSAASASVRGATAVYNGRNGATVAGQSIADFGQSTGGDGGNNAFTQNGTTRALNGHNLDNSSARPNVTAGANQWQHCYADPAHPGAVCDGNIRLDTRGSLDVSSPQPYRADDQLLPLQISGFFPTKAKAGDLVRIVGGGFNAIDPYPAGGNCTTTALRTNTCGSPIAGNCVQYESAPGVWTTLEVQAVTPTEIVVKLPPTFTCSQPVSVSVQRLDANGMPVGTTATFCTNS